jgi:hypothetical protein
VPRIAVDSASHRPPGPPVPPAASCARLSRVDGCSEDHRFSWCAPRPHVISTAEAAQASQWSSQGFAVCAFGPSSASHPPPDSSDVHERPALRHLRPDTRASRPAGQRRRGHGRSSLSRCRALGSRICADEVDRRRVGSERRQPWPELGRPCQGQPEAHRWGSDAGSHELVVVEDLCEVGVRFHAGRGPPGRAVRHRGHRWAAAGLDVPPSQRAVAVRPCRSAMTAASRSPTQQRRTRGGHREQARTRTLPRTCPGRLPRRGSRPTGQVVQERPQARRWQARVHKEPPARFLRVRRRPTGDAGLTNDVRSLGYSGSTPSHGMVPAAWPVPQWPGSECSEPTVGAGLAGCGLNSLLRPDAWPRGDHPCP